MVNGVGGGAGESLGGIKRFSSVYGSHREQLSRQSKGQKEQVN